MKYILLIALIFASLPALAQEQPYNPIGGTIIGEPAPITSPPPIGSPPLGGTDIR